MDQWELLIIGAGAAGLTAGIYGARSGLKTLILEGKAAGGMVSLAPWVENYPGFPEGIAGSDLTEKMLSQCRKFGAEIRECEDLTDLAFKAEMKIVKTESSEYSARAVIIASGSRHRVLGVIGEEAFRGKGVSYCATCDGFFFKGKKVVVVGGGNTAAMSALYLSNLASEIYLVHRREQLRAEEVYVKELAKKGVKFLFNTEVKAIRGSSKVEKVLLFDTKAGEKREIEADGVFILIGEEPNSTFAKEAGVKVDEHGYILVDSLQRTNVPGVYAAGDVTQCPVKQIGTAVGQAMVAAADAFGYIKKPYYY
jgi:thioredoxin reductase (NADPH)